MATVSPSGQPGMGISQETPLYLPQTDQAHRFLISHLSSSDLGLRPSLGDPPAGRGDGGEKEGTRPAAGVTCAPWQEEESAPQVGV